MKILDALLVLKEQAGKGCINAEWHGICYNLFQLTGETSTSYDLVMNHCKDWKYFSGDNVYPVVLDADCKLWEGEQLELRLSLLEHLINKAREQGV